MELLLNVLLWLLLIFLGLIFLVFLLTLLPVKVQLHYGANTREVKVKYLFFTFDILTDKKGKGKGATEKKKEIQEPEEQKKEEEPNLFRDFRFLKKILSKASDNVKRLLRHLHIRQFDFYLSMGTDDPATTGVLFGQLCAFVYTAISFLDKFFLIEYKRVELLPNFHEENFELEFGCTISLQPIIALLIGADIYRTLLQEKRKRKKREKQQKIKETEKPA